MERVKSHHAIWHEFINVVGILNMEVHKKFEDLSMGLQKDPDRYFVRDLMQLYENNRVMVDILHES